MNPVTYDRVEVLTFENGTQAKHVAKEITLYNEKQPQASQRYLEGWQDINPSITAVSFVYLNPRSRVHYLCD